uniref:SH3 domain-containing protein n=1 Tax=Caenorhabditis tropicalis TaxID=1561998 RepID=A0A1I7T6F3_9PELO
MADLFNKHLKKATNRTKEKLLEGIGKAKATQDEVFDQHAANLSRQSKSCEKLHKDVKTYASALKTLLSAEKQLRDTIREAYEPDWPDREHLTAIFDNLDIQTDELEKKVCEDLPQTVTQYVNQFPDLKKKIEKRGRKLVDYDSAKNTFNSVKASSKKDNDPKLAKATTELQNAEQLYTEMNNELLEILPAVYDSRITFFVDTLQSLFNANSVYQTDASKFHKQIVMQLDKLGESMDYLRVARPEARALTPIDTTSLTSNDAPATPDQNKSDNTSLRQSTPSPTVRSSPAPLAVPIMKPRESVASIANSTNPFDDEEAEDEKPTPTEVEEKFEAKVYPKLNAQQAAAADQAIAAARREKKEASNPFDDEDEDEKTEKEDPKTPKVEEPEPAPKPLDGITNEKRKTLYFVTSTHEYKAVDTDELSFESGMKIKVIEANDADQLDEGWRLGELEDGKRGVFPENFTKKI